MIHCFRDVLDVCWNDMQIGSRRLIEDSCKHELLRVVAITTITFLWRGILIGIQLPVPMSIGLLIY